MDWMSRSERYAVVITISRNPEAIRDRITKSMHGRPAIGIRGFGRRKVSGFSRVPSPPARMTAFIPSSPRAPS